MSKFPVEQSDDEGIADAINYLLSGPSGLGQNFAGFSDSTTSDLTGNFRPPFTQFNGNVLPNVALRVPPIALSTSEMLDSRTIKCTFSTPFAQPQFVLGQAYGLTVTGVSIPDYDTYIYDNGYQIGIVESTTSYVVIRLNQDLPLLAVGTGGTIELISMDLLFSTDCNAKVTVTSATDRVILNAQLNNTIYTDPANYPGSYYYVVQLNRYIGVPTSDPINPDFRFEFDKTIAYKQYLVSTPSTGITNEYETFFIGVLDQPGLGQTNFKGAYYWYIVEVKFMDNAGGQVVDNCVLGLRSFSSQVLKQ